MSKIGNHVVGLKETDDYRYGRESAERGEPAPSWLPQWSHDHDRLAAQNLGWQDYHIESTSL